MRGDKKIAKPKKVSNMCHAIDNLLLHANARHALVRFVNALRFIAFEEKDPKHSVFELQPWHVLATFALLYIGPAQVFFHLIPYGFPWVIIGEMALLLTVLEVMHAFCDR